MTLKANLLEELSKLRLSRERPFGKQAKVKKDKVTLEEKDLLNQLNFEGE